MLTVEIVLIGQSSVGKSTIVNTLMGNLHSKINTDVESVFNIGIFDKYTSNEDIVKDLYKGEVYLPFPESFYLDKKYNYKFSDLVGVTRDKIRKDDTGKIIRDNCQDYDIYGYVCNIETFYENKKHIIESLKFIEGKMNNPSQLLIILNKCDGMIHDGTAPYYADIDKKEKVNSIITYLNDNNYFNIVQMCAIESMKISAGDNKCYANENEKNEYFAKSKGFGSERYLMINGFFSLVKKIGEFVETNKSRIINKHSLNELYETKCTTFDQIINLLNKFEDISDGDISLGVKEYILEYIRQKIELEKSKESDEYVELLERESSDLNNKYDSICVENDIYKRELVDECAKLLSDAKIEHLKYKFEYHYDFNALSKLLRINIFDNKWFFECLKAHIAPTNLLDSFNSVAILTNNNPEHLYVVLNAYCDNLNNRQILYVMEQTNTNSTPIMSYLISRLLNNEYKGFKEIISMNTDYELYKNNFLKVLWMNYCVVESLDKTNEILSDESSNDSK